MDTYKWLEQQPLLLNGSECLWNWQNRNGWFLHPIPIILFTGEILTLFSIYIHFGIVQIVWTGIIRASRCTCCVWRWRWWRPMTIYLIYHSFKSHMANLKSFNFQQNIFMLLCERNFKWVDFECKDIFPCRSQFSENGKSFW